jgi:hypothetical protein
MNGMMANAFSTKKASKVIASDADDEASAVKPSRQKGMRARVCSI